jgi:hypothetical protein
MSRPSPENAMINVRLHIREFIIPPITDALVLGKKAPIGSEAIRRALTLLHVAPFAHVAIEDDIVEDIIVRKSVLNKIPEKKLVPLVLKRIKPFMTIDEVIHVDLKPELILDEQI